MPRALLNSLRASALAAALLLASPALAVTSIGTDISTDGVLTANGNVIMNDASADTILLGQNGGTPDVITIAGDVSITDTNWSISAAGIFTGDGSGLINVGGGAIGDGSVTAKKLQTAAADLGAADVNVNLGNTNGAFNTNLTLDGTLTANALKSMTNLAVRDQSAAFDVLLAFDSNPVITADRQLLIDVANADRNVVLQGNLTLTGDFDTFGGNSVTLMTTGATSLTLPTTGTLATLSGNEVLSGKTLRNGVIFDRAGVNDDQLAIDVLPGGAAKFTGSIGNFTDLTADRSYVLPNDSGNFALGTLGNPLFFTTSAATTVTLPTTGTLATLAGIESLSNKTLTNPKINAIHAAAGGQVAQFVAAAATDNFFVLTGQTTGLSPQLAVTGLDGNIDLNIMLKGNGELGVFSNAGSSDFLVLKPNAAGAGSFRGTITSADITGTHKTWTLQDADGIVPLSTVGNTLFFTTTAATALTLPVSGTLATLAGVEALTNKTLGATSVTGAMTFSGTSPDVTTGANEDFTLAPNGTGRIILAKPVVDSNFGLSIADNTVGATPAASTLSPQTSYSEVDCGDPDGCDLTLGEVGAMQGMQFTIVNNSANMLNFADTAGVSELAGAFAAGQYDSITFRYMFDRWVEIARSNN